VAEQLGLVSSDDRPPLAIASCGNAALAAAVVAKAGTRRLEVFVPVDAEPSVLSRLKELDAEVVVCPRDPSIPGDPAYLRLQQAIADGALPFTTQGNENGLSIEGGITLGYELAARVNELPGGVDRVVVQVGGGALATAIGQGLREARALGLSTGPARFHAVQTAGVHPLQRAFERAAADGRSPGEAMRHARSHRSQYMWPWENPPHSLAHGILDDETYDWATVVEGMLDTSGSPVVVSEETLEEANRLAFETTGIPADHTGTSGLAGVLELRRNETVGHGERIAVVFTGVRRSEDGSGEQREGST
jgi:threonine synthase